MSEERRSGGRKHILGVRVTYEGATGGLVEADVLDLATGGMFIRSKAPLAVGKRLALDLHVLGESGSFTAIARVIWSRPATETGAPAGMGVKLIDVDDATGEVLARLIDTREPTALGVGEMPPAVSAAPVVLAAPDRERTLMGVGSGSEPPPPLALPLAPARPAWPEPAAPREPSVAIDLVVAKKLAPVPAAAGSPASAPAEDLPSPPRESAGGGTARWVVILLMIIVAGIAAYVLLDGFLRPMSR